MHQHLFILTKSQDFRLANSALQYSLPYLHELFTLENAIDVGNTRHMRNDTSPSLTRYSGSQEQVKFMQLYLRQRSYFFLRLQKVIFWTFSSFLNIKLRIYVLSRPSICCCKVMD